MLRWGRIEKAIDVRAAAASVDRSDLHREAAADLGIAALAAYEKSGGPFLDGRTFDAADVVAHLAGYEVHDRRVPLDELAAAQRTRS